MELKLLFYRSFKNTKPKAQMSNQIQNLNDKIKLKPFWILSFELDLKFGF